MREGENKPAQDRPRKAYHPPRLVDYGSIARLVKGGAASVVSDHGANMMYP